MRYFALAGLVYWLLVSGLLLILHGDELDLDSMFPIVGQSSGMTVSHDSTPSNPPLAVILALMVVGIVIGVPVVWPIKTFVVALRISSVAVGACLVATITRLGLVLTPVLALQLLALYRGDVTSSQET